MQEMKTLTIDGTTYEVVDEKARKAAEELAGVVVTVAPAGADATKYDFVCDGTADQETIQEAILSLPTCGGTVKLAGNFYLSAPVNGGGKCNVIITGGILHRKSDFSGGSLDTSSYKAGLIEHTGANWTFKDVKFVGDPEKSKHQVHFGMQGKSGDKYINCEFTDWKYYALKCEAAKVLNCRFVNNESAIYRVCLGRVEGCYFQNNGVCIDNVGLGTVFNNSMLDNDVGIVVYGTGGGKVIGNRISRGEGTEADYTDDQYTIQFGSDWGSDSTPVFYDSGNVVYGNMLYGKDVVIYRQEDATEEELAKLADNIIRNNLAGAGGGAGTWAELPDKPFYDTREYSEKVIEWDGTTEGKTFIEDLGLYKVSDEILTNDEVRTIVATLGEESVAIGELFYDMLTAGFVNDDFAFLEVVLVVKKPNITIDAMGITIAETGVYVSEGVTVSYTKTIGELVQIEDKYIKYDPKIFEVNFTHDYETENNPILCDKTKDEIKQAIINKMNVKGFYKPSGGRIHNLELASYLNDFDDVIFNGFGMLGFDGKIMQFRIMSENQIEYSERTIATS